MAGMLPFIILFFFTITLATDRTVGATGMVFRVWLARAMWVFFIGFMIYKLTSAEAVAASEGLWNTISWILTAVAVGAVIFMAALFERVRRARNIAVRALSRETSRTAAERERNLAEAAEATAERSSTFPER